MGGTLTQKAESAREEFQGQHLPPGPAVRTEGLAHSTRLPSRPAKPRPKAPTKQGHQNFISENIHSFYFKRSIKASW